MTDLTSRNNKDLHNNIDLHDAYSLGHVSIEWLAVLIRQIGKEVKYIQKELVDQGGDDSNFYDLDKLIAVASFTADEQLESFDSLKTRFENLIGLMCAEIAGDFHLGDSRQPTYKNSLPFDSVS